MLFLNNSFEPLNISKNTVSKNRFYRLSFSVFDFHSIYVECDNNTFGVNCTGVCENCLGKEQCHYINGSCLNGCDAGFNGLKCDQGNYEITKI